MFALVFSLTGCKDDDSDGDQNAAATVMVRFDINGGTGTTPAAKTVNQGTGITLPSGSGFYKSGFAFGGWNTNAEGTGTNYSASSSFTPNGDITLYAKWDAVGETYTVTFRLNSGSGTTPAPMQVPAGESVTLPSEYGIVRTGYSFMGWNTAANGLGDNYEAGESFTPADNIILYAKWVAGYNVTFDAVNAACKGAVPPSQLVPAGSSITLPGKGSLSLAYSNFNGWNTLPGGVGTAYAAGSSYTPISAVTLYAHWVSDGTTYESLTELDKQLDWLQVYAENSAEYEIDVTADVDIDPQTPLFDNNRRNVKITLKGSGGNRTVRLASDGRMFNVNNGGTLILEDITLEGRDNNTDSLVAVGNDAVLTMKNGSVISDNNSSNYGGGGVTVYGTFTMQGGTITGNSGARGGGVYVTGGATFTMTGGTISGNAAAFASVGGIAGAGGGVYVAGNGTFNMQGGTISGNTADVYGGGVFVFTALNWNYGNFYKTGGTIYGYDANDKVNSNVVRDSSGVLSNKGHAAYAGEAITLKVEATSGTTHSFYGYGSGGQYFNYAGWD